MVLLLSGCGESQPARFPISGSVSLDGNPVNDAVIIFAPVGEGKAAVAEIVAGNFSLEEAQGPTAGDFQIRINPNEGEMEEVVEGDIAPGAAQTGKKRIPKVYQRPGKLTATVSAEVGNSFKFELDSRGK